MSQSVIVTIGAALAGNFLSTFNSADKTVKNLAASVRVLDTVLQSIAKRAGSTAKSLESIVKSTNVLTVATNQTIAADRNAVRANADLARSNAALGRSYDTLRKQRQDLNAATRRGPLPFGATVAGAGAGGGGIGGLVTGGVAGAAFGHGGGSIYDEHGVLMKGADKTIMAGTALTAASLAAGAAIGMTAHSAAELDTVLQKVAVTSERGTESVARWRETLMGLSANDKTAQSTKGLADALFLLTSAGRDLETQALPSLGTIGKVATAYEADTQDVANMTNTLLDSFLIVPEKMEQAYDIIGKVEKEGRIKLKDFSAILPTIGGIAHLNKISGLQGVADVTSALEIIRKQTSTSGEAATRLEDLLSSMTQKYTQSAFDAVGINLEAEIKRGDAAGKSRLKTLVDVVTRYSHGDPFRIGELFRNKEAKDALSSLIMFRSEWDKLGADGMKSHGIIEHDFLQMAGSLENSMRTIKNSVMNVIYIVGIAFAPAIRALATTVQFVSQHVVKFISHHQALAKVIGVVVVGLTGLTFALGGTLLAVGLLGKAILWGNIACKAFGASLRLVAMEVPALAIASTNTAMVMEGGLFLTMRALGAWVVATWSTVIVPAFLAGLQAIEFAVAPVIIALAAISAPVWAVVGAVVAAIAIVAFVVWKFWKPIKQFFTSIWDGFMEGMAPVGAAFREAIAPIIPIWEDIKTAIGDCWETIKGFFSQVDESSEIMAAAKVAGQALGWVIANTIAPAVLVLVSGLKLVVQTLVDIIHYAKEAADWLGFKKVTDWLGITGKKDKKKKGADSDAPDGTKVIGSEVKKDKSGNVAVWQSSSSPQSDEAAPDASNTKVIGDTTKSGAVGSSVSSDDDETERKEPPKPAFSWGRQALKLAVSPFVPLLGPVIAYKAVKESVNHLRGKDEEQEATAIPPKLDKEMSGLFADKNAVSSSNSSSTVTQNNNQRVEVNVTNANASADDIRDGVTDGLSSHTNSAARDLRGAHTP